MLVRHKEAPHPERSRALRLVRRLLPVTDAPAGGHFFVLVDGKRMVTSLFLALVAIEASDAVFAVDSIFAIFAITMDPFIVLTSNIFAILGLRSLYFVLSGAAERFRYVQPGLALVLVFVGGKMLLSDAVPIPVAVSLAIVALLIGGSVVASIVHARRALRARFG